MKDCKEAILSESYRDFMFNSRWMQLLDGLDPRSWCRKEAGQMYWNVYIQEEEADRLPINDIPYYSIPKCFTLLDLGSLNAAGITPVQSYPSLELKGQGILMGFWIPDLTTAIQCSGIWMAPRASWESGTRRYRMETRKSILGTEVSTQGRTSTALCKAKILLPLYRHRIQTDMGLSRQVWRPEVQMWKINSLGQRRNQ